MGICLDTEPRPGSETSFEERRKGFAEEDEEEEEPRFVSRRAIRQGPNTAVKFEPPNVPVIFILGGPGSGKVTHCDALASEKRGFVHINMTDLLQQFAVGNELSDFSQLPSTAVTEVLMLEMKMAASAKVYLVSGFPRSMRDMAEYSDKIQVLNGAVLLSWRQKVLARQVEYGAKLGHVVLSLATMELRNFYRSVMPVADYLDQRGHLMVVDGERNPEEVYRDFKETVMQLLTPKNSQPGQITEARVAAVIETPSLGPGQMVPYPDRMSAPVQPFPMPPTVFIIGGPGSNKTALCQRALRRTPGWGLVSLGRQLRAAAGGSSAPANPGQQQLRDNIAAGEMAMQTVVLALLGEQMSVQAGARGLLIAGFPRDLQQLRAFEARYNQRPAAILLDCSKLQLGRGRLDDSVSAFRRRLELFRELTLPLLKKLDQENRLTIVDGDTDSAAVLEDFCAVLAGLMSKAESAATMNGAPNVAVGAGAEFMAATTGAEFHQALFQDLNSRNDVAGPVQLNGAVRNGTVSDTFSNGGLLGARRPSRDSIRKMFAEVEEFGAA
ncbi:adenylate kinase isoenzyme 5 [Neocloeon triangulifer]|uniref:adenylate kinase isoenzyme 5 n=1 Tax=Neocloeon triangulifer TaxID=2078957 RepID=UPI00286F1502|nr:adenylate kinase isoenzyme 5 [Neocloeon triangulifer]